VLAKLYSGAVYGVDAYAVEIEVNAGRGEPKVVIVGLPDAAVKESSDRVWTALINSGFAPPMGRTTINLAPADIKKEGPSFDLPIALGMLAATDAIPAEALQTYCVTGELALSGEVRPCAASCPCPSWPVARAGRASWCRLTMPKKRRWFRACRCSRWRICDRPRILCRAKSTSRLFRWM
jgi:magnesium chelatase family protein